MFNYNEGRTRKYVLHYYARFHREIYDLEACSLFIFLCAGLFASFC